MKKIYLGLFLATFLLSACSINSEQLKNPFDLSKNQEEVANENFTEPTKKSDWIEITEWDLKYTTNSLNSLSYEFEPIADFPGRTEGLTSRVSFKYQALNDDNQEISLGWENCPLPSITEFTTDPTNKVLGAASDKVKKINDKYYLLGGDPHEPCRSIDGEIIISGTVENLWQERRALVFEIFNSLQNN